MNRPGGLDRRKADAGLKLAGELTVEILGNPFAVASTSPALASTLASLLAAFPAASGPPPVDHRFLVVDGCPRHGGRLCVHQGGDGAHVASSAGGLLSWLLAELTAAALDAFAGFAVHAGVVAWDGRAIALPAESGGGKTTLVAAALVTGSDYVSDEVLGVDFAAQEVVSCPRPLVLSTWSRDRVGTGSAPAVALASGEWALTPAQLGADVAGPHLRLAHIVRPVRRAGPPALVRAERSEAMGWLLQRSFNHYRRPGRSFALAADLARRAEPWRLEFDDPLEAAALLLARLGQPGR